MLAWFALLLVGSATIAWLVNAWLVRIPNNRLGFVAAWGLGVLLALIVLINGAPGTVPASVALLLGALILSLYATSAQRAEPRAISVGDKLPAFRAPDDSGTMVDSSAFAGSAMLLKVFRGHW